IDYVINTHPHSDHIGGLIKVFENFKVNKFYYPYDIEMKRYEGFEGAESIENEGYKINCMNYCYQFYKRVLDLAVEKNVEIHDTIPASYIDPNNILKFVHPDKVYKQNYLDKAPEDIIGTDYDAFNSDSAVVMVDYYNFKMLITGDINKETEIDMVNLGLIPKDKINVLKVSHHGYNTSSSKELIDAIRPTFGVVTRSKIMENSPECKETNKLLRDYKVDLLETWRGNVKVYATDKAWNIEY
ncbi:MBL fold metallo-hydrolase, partial [Clostridium sp.]|uniref:ComEC/Rec2 family competence protein n=1 Tax=Clostridium sp. TaxID=1506 RepID=UPI002608E7F7